MASVYVRRRVTQDGVERFDVRYRLGGRAVPLRHGGTFGSLDDAELRAASVRRQIAQGAAHIRLTAASPETWIYYIRVGVDGPIKIGLARDPMRRMRHLQSANPYPLHLLAVEPGTAEDEEQIHRAFMDARLRGEWFRPTEAVLDHVRCITGEGDSKPEAARRRAVVIHEPVQSDERAANAA